MRYQSFRRGSPNKRGEEIEKAAQQVDEYLYVDEAFEKPGWLQLWRKHPVGNFPMLIFDIPSHVSPEGVVRMLESIDQGGKDITKGAEDEASRARDYAKNKRVETHQGKLKEVATYVRNNLL